MSREERPKKRMRRAERLQSAASLQRQRSPFDAATFAQPAVEATLMNLDFDAAVNFCSTSSRVHTTCAKVSFWRAWLNRRAVQYADWRLRSDSDTSLDRAFRSAAESNTGSFSPRSFMYLLKIVQTLPPGVRKSTLEDFGIELLRRSRTAETNADLTVLERKWRHFLDALAESDVTTIHTIIDGDFVIAILATRALSEPLVRALFALPNAYGDDRLQPADLERKQNARKQLLFNTMLTVLNDDGNEYEMSVLEAAVAFGNASLVRLLLETVLQEYRNLERQPDTTPYRRERLRNMRQALVDDLYQWVRADDRHEDENSDSEFGEMQQEFENALSEADLDAIVDALLDQ